MGQSIVVCRYCGAETAPNRRGPGHWDTCPECREGERDVPRLHAGQSTEEDGSGWEVMRHRLTGSGLRPVWASKHLDTGIPGERITR